VPHRQCGDNGENSRTRAQSVLADGTAPYLESSQWSPPNAEQHIPGWVEFRYLWPKIVPYGFEQTSELRRRRIPVFRSTDSSFGNRSPED